MAEQWLPCPHTHRCSQNKHTLCQHDQTKQSPQQPQLTAKQQRPWFPLIPGEFTGLTDAPQLSFTWELEAMKN